MLLPPRPALIAVLPISLPSPTPGLLWLPYPHIAPPPHSPHFAPLVPGLENGWGTIEYKSTVEVLEDVRHVLNTCRVNSISEEHRCASWAIVVPRRSGSACSVGWKFGHEASGLY